VNLILFEPGELDRPLPLSDPRAIHLVEVLRRVPGDQCDAGIVNGDRGKATLVKVGAHGLVLSFTPTARPLPVDPVHLVLAVPRPQTARKILLEAASLGVASLHFFPADKSEKAYASSTLWSSGEWRRHLVSGAEQAFDTRLPEVHQHDSLAAAVSATEAGNARLALDNYEATARLTPGLRPMPVVLAFGPERGWAAQERTLLREHRFELAHLGPRVLRTETAVVAAVAIVKARG
jgi:16S rRNA (uracil1498-N3)-methyltransferase